MKSLLILAVVLFAAHPVEQPVPPASARVPNLYKVSLQLSDLPKGYVQQGGGIPAGSTALPGSYRVYFTSPNQANPHGWQIQVLMTNYPTAQAAQRIMEGSQQGTVLQANKQFPWTPKNLGNEADGYRCTPEVEQNCPTSMGATYYQVNFRRGLTLVFLSVTGIPHKFEPKYAGQYAHIMDNRMPH